MSDVLLQPRLALATDTDARIMSAFVRQNVEGLREAGFIGVVRRYQIALEAMRGAERWRSEAINARLQPFYIRNESRIVGIASILPSLELLEPTHPAAGLLPKAVQKFVPGAHRVRIPAEDSVNVAMYVQKDTDGAIGFAAVRQLTDIATDQFVGRTAWALVDPDAQTLENNRVASYLRNGYAVQDTARFDDREPRMWTMPISHLVTKNL